MSAERKTSAKVEQVKGAVKENVGRAVGDEGMAAEGSAERAKGDLRQAGEKAKDAFKR
ncbi:CsbD family protein [Streptomyces somaliensis]|uniref:CsbD family protein n=1 Tax=Streptomyces somaliensis (strain ATCC 33201 / DSM 40738 / JCM 12659 / KCTC 9044 / NCTC 11332 / NRRL B-12077 / IP 733) TaxID=1134445 RepID=A0AA44DDJ5_STRE0|nr:CsbD family protein [Streptomyces somaliensis]MCP9943774.1 CsbD family protein [Streptomyces somaliensis]MCP9962976.1 CsbD family protein [Streptomyces somaliensis]MCP9975824.1 CsbD family protein [Streptomyces somaliensis]MCQ0025200.1 CsbD family protein [Streptomyces somaliensis DSM 40738]NKY14519.1 CsbD family protein [Streptomyces somaliensis DSM 40738]